jgi:cellulose synthase/poly-beta-1,6-N-acetylglucosamine synthase-like glycosyltransferase
MVPPVAGTVGHRLAEFFWTIKNRVRPLGLMRLGLPVQLMGAGMMLPWHVIVDAPLANGNLVEDLKLGLDLAAAGHPPTFCPAAIVTSEFPLNGKGTDSQRQRWIQGHISLMVGLVPKYLRRACLERDLPLLALTLDVLVPPFSLFLPLLSLAFFAGFFLFLVEGAATPFLICLANCLMVLSALVLSWRCFGRDVIPATEARSVIAFLATRLSFYGRAYFGSRAASWVRTDRSKRDLGSVTSSQEQPSTQITSA